MLVLQCLWPHIGSVVSVKNVRSEESISSIFFRFYLCFIHCPFVSEWCSQLFHNLYEMHVYYFQL
jgi:hypothetical protein